MDQRFNLRTDFGGLDCRSWQPSPTKRCLTSGQPMVSRVPLGLSPLRAGGSTCAWSSWASGRISSRPNRAPRASGSSSLRPWSRRRIGVQGGLAANEPQGKAITSGIKTGGGGSHADYVRCPYLQQNRMVGYFVILVAAIVSPIFSNFAMADEGGVSFWLPCAFRRRRAAPSQPGWLFEGTYYHASAAASHGVSFVRGGGIEAGVKSPTDYFFFTPPYTFANQILGAQPAFGM